MERLFRKPVETWCEYLGEEIEVSVECDYQPPEQHAYESLELTSVFSDEHGQVLETMLEHERKSLQNRMLEDARYYGSKRRSVRAALADQARAQQEIANQRRLAV